MVTDRIIRKLSNVESSDGVLAEVELPQMQSLDSCSKIVVVDRIQDPGNLGTIIRSALSLGWQGIFLQTSGYPSESL